MSAPHSPKAADKTPADAEAAKDPVSIPTGDEAKEKLAAVEEDDEPEQLQIDTSQDAAVCLLGWKHFTSVLLLQEPATSTPSEEQAAKAPE